MAATLVVIIGLTVYSLVANGGSGAGTTAAGTTTPAPVTTTLGAPATTTTPAPTHTPTPQVTTTQPTVAPSSDVALVQPHGVTVRLNVTSSRSWFHVADSTGKTLFEGILSAGQTKDFQDAKEIRMTIGAPKVVDLVVNGKDIGSVVTSGAVAHEVFTPAPGSNAAHG
jgi:cytoskeleton protein RodZ